MPTSGAHTLREKYFTDFICFLLCHQRALADPLHRARKCYTCQVQAACQKVGRCATHASRSSRALLSPKNNNPQNRTTREVRLESEFPFERGANPLAMCRSGCSKNLERTLRARTPKLGFFIKGENSLSLARSLSAPVKLEPTSLTERTLSTSIYTMRRDGLFHYSGHILIELGSACAPQWKFHLVERLGVERGGGLTNLC
jgi:hypothetical protein